MRRKKKCENQTDEARNWFQKNDEEINFQSIDIIVSVDRR